MFPVTYVALWPFPFGATCDCCGKLSLEHVLIFVGLLACSCGSVLQTDPGADKTILVVPKNKHILVGPLMILLFAT